MQPLCAVCPHVHVSLRLGVQHDPILILSAPCHQPFINLDSIMTGSGCHHALPCHDPHIILDHLPLHQHNISTTSSCTWRLML